MLVATTRHSSKSKEAEGHSYKMSLKVFTVLSTPIPGSVNIDRIVTLLKEHRPNVVIVCGVSSYRNLFDLWSNIYGLLQLEDDIYNIRFLKKRGRYISGSWQSIETQICVGGIDSKNPLQNYERLRSTAPNWCRYALIVSIYPPKGSRCSKVRILGKELSIGIHSLLDFSQLFSKTVILVCNNSLKDEICIDNASDNLVIVALKKEVTVITIDFETLNVEVVT